MDRSLYVGMTGAMQTLLAQATNSNNLANASTVGFRAQLDEAQAVEVSGPGLASRVNVQASDAGWDSSTGSIEQTGRDTDIALRTQSWLAVQASDGTEAYTKAGNLQVDVNGQLLTGTGQPVLGDNGPLSVPPHSSVTIGNDGTVSITPLGQSGATQAVVGRLKIVDAQPLQLQRGSDGLMRVTPGETLEPAAGEVVTAGAVESSNVSLASTMVRMIQLSRQFELQTKLMQSSDQNSQASSSLVKLS